MLPARLAPEKVFFSFIPKAVAVGSFSNAYMSYLDHASYLFSSPDQSPEYGHPIAVLERQR